MHPGEESSVSKKLIVLDTDMAPDSWMAILYLVRCTKVSLQAITLAGTGESHGKRGARNALGLLSLAGDVDIPVTYGRKTPLRGKHSFPLIMRYAMDLMLGLSLPSSPRPLSSQRAVELLISTIESAPRKVVLVTVGPLTNVAEAILAQPAIVEKLDMVYIMGGAVDVPGNIQSIAKWSKNSVAEWNIYCDPYAANVVLTSGAPITLVPLDVTNKVPLTMDFYNRIEADRTTPEADFVYRILSRLKPTIRTHEYFFWDPLTAAVAADESMATFQQRSVKVIYEEGPESGRTLEAEGGVDIRMCTTVDSARFEQVFLDTLNSRTV
jgi:pyrimidine-specific ribonucleoside hydrolase